MSTTPTNFVMPADVHNAIVAAAYRHRGYAAVLYTGMTTETVGGEDI